MTIDYQSPSLHSEIASTLKHMVIQSVCQLRIAEPTSDKARRRKAEITASTVEKFSISFLLPGDCIINKIDMDKVVLSYQNFTQLSAEGKTYLTRRFSFKERMKGWNIERRQRENGTYDVFYSHSKSRRMFRFIAEVVNFLQYEVYYDNQIKNRTPEENSVKHMSKEASTVTRKRKSTSSKSSKRHKAYTSENSSNFEGQQNVTSENNMLKKTNSYNISDKKVVQYLGKTIAFLIPEEENGYEVVTIKTVDATLIKEGESNVELQGDGSLEEMLDIYKNAKIDQKEVNYDFPDLCDEMFMDWNESDGLINAYYEECELICHIPICRNVDELVEYLITERNQRRG